MPEDTRPQTVEELNRQLADTIGASVEQLMGQTGWVEANNMLINPRGQDGQPGPTGGGEERPGAAPPAGQPAPTGAPALTASPVTATIPVLDFEKYKDPATGMYAKKYKTVEEFAAGLGHAMNMTYSVLTQNEQANQRIAALTAELEQSRRQPVGPQSTVSQDTSVIAPSRGDVSKVSPKLAEALASLQEDNTLDAEGLVRLTDAISEHTVETARRVAREEVEARDKVAQATKERWDKVDSFMSGKYPNSMNFTTELGVFSKANPVIGQVVSALIEKDLHEQAMTFVWQEFATAHGLNPSAVAPAPEAKPFVPAPATKENVEKEIRLDAADQVRREAVENARKDAGIIPSMAGGVHGVHENANAAPTQEEMDEAVRLMQQGHGERFRNIVFRDILNHPLFN
jgi:hypothetical protein